MTRASAEARLRRASPLSHEPCPALNLRRSLPLVSTLGAALIFTACGQTRGPALDAGAVGDAELRLAALTDTDQRVARVAQRLSDANADVCPTVRMSAGWALHSARQYSPELRPFAEARFGLDGDLPGLLAVPPGSAAAAAGLRQGDLILSANGRWLSRGDGRREAAFEGLANNMRVLDAAMAKGPMSLAVRRDGREITLSIAPRRSCGYDVQLNPSDELNARADGRRLFISTALAGFAQTDDELALILGHELAHHVLGHREWNETGGGGREANAPAVDGEGRSGHPERQADRVGLFLAAKAGFDTSVAGPFWRRFGASNWRVRYPQLGHDSAGARAVAVDAAHAEIEDLRRNGQPLRF